MSLVSIKKVFNFSLMQTRGIVSYKTQPVKISNKRCFPLRNVKYFTFHN